MDIEGDLRLLSRIELPWGMDLSMFSSTMFEESWSWIFGNSRGLGLTRIPFMIIGSFLPSLFLEVAPLIPLTFDWRIRDPPDLNLERPPPSLERPPVKRERPPDTFLRKVMESNLLYSYELPPPRRDLPPPRRDLPPPSLLFPPFIVMISFKKF